MFFHLRSRWRKKRVLKKSWKKKDHCQNARIIFLSVWCCNIHFSHKRLKSTNPLCSKEDLKHSCFPPGETWMHLVWSDPPVAEMSITTTNTQKKMTKKNNKKLALYKFIVMFNLKGLALKLVANWAIYVNTCANENTRNWRSQKQTQH